MDSLHQDYAEVKASLGSAEPPPAVPIDEDGGGGAAENVPPCLTGGSNQGDVRFLDSKARGASIDWLSVTLDAKIARKFFQHQPLVKSGRGTAGFLRSASYAYLYPSWLPDGGVVTGFAKLVRKRMPLVESKRWGREYESIDASGAGADCFAQQMSGLVGEESRASRIDFAFDLSCASGFTPEMFVASIKGRLEEQGLTERIAGTNGVNTCYVGAVGAGREIRIYRKDREDAEYGYYHGPTLRIELIDRDERADQLWQTYRVDREAAYALAVAHIEALTGFQIEGQGFADVPALTAPAASDVVEKVVQFAKQYGPFIASCTRAGIDLAAISAKQAENCSKSSARRSRLLEEEIKLAGAESVTERALARVGRTDEDDPAGAQEPDQRPKASASLDRAGLCRVCGKTTRHWVSFDGRNGSCLCRECAGLPPIVNQQEEWGDGNARQGHEASEGLESLQEEVGFRDGAAESLRSRERVYGSALVRSGAEAGGQGGPVDVELRQGLYLPELERGTEGTISS